MALVKVPKIIIPETIQSAYAGAFSEMKSGDNTLIGYKEHLDAIQSKMCDVASPSLILLAEPGMGKTALVEQTIYNSHHLDESEVTQYRKPLLVVRLDIERLGTLGTNIMVSRLRTIFTAMNEIETATRQANPTLQFKIVLFIDEIHKLQAYGSGKTSSQAMNALKEGTARGEFPIIGATTNTEYKDFIRPDLAFVRRFPIIALKEPDIETTKEILKRQAQRLFEHENSFLTLTDSFLDELLDLTKNYIKSQVNPAKSISILNSTIGYARAFDKPLDHNALSFVFKTLGYNIDVNIDTNKAKDYMLQNIIGQPLAIEMMVNMLKTSKYLAGSRDHSQPLGTAFFGGSTGTGKSELSKILAKLIFGRREALVTLNGGDYPDARDALTAQHFIGDAMIASKERIILLDEIEKSHPAVLMAYMRMIDEGIVRDSDGVEQSLNNTFIIATSNLAYQQFSGLKAQLKLESNKDPQDLTDEQIRRWKTAETSMREALVKGDEGKNNGLRPEFLERFQAFVPFMPFSKQVIGKIAHLMLETAYRDLRADGVRIQTPAPQSEKYYQKLFGTDKVHYGGLTTIDVFVTLDVMPPDASLSGARTISRFIKDNLRPKIANLKSDLIDKGVDFRKGVFRISTNGNTSVDRDTREYGDIEVTFVSDYA